jgi:hypothetical protein
LLAVNKWLFWRQSGIFMGALCMWRDQLDVFWDGGHVLALGFFDSEEPVGAPSSRPELIVSSARDQNFSRDAALIDVIDVLRWRRGHAIVTLPSDHVFVHLRAADGAELRLALMGEKTETPGGEWRVLLNELPDPAARPSGPFRVASLSARGDFERLAREQVARSGARLVWAICQRRHMERRDGAARLAHLWPTRRLFPAHQSRIVLEAIEPPVEGVNDDVRAPFAIMDHWVRENGAQRVMLRIRAPDALHQSEALLGRTAVVLVMHQRRRLRDWAREQRELGDPTIDPLTFDDIRVATADPLETPDAVESNESIVVCNLLELIANPDEASFDGFAIRRHSDGAGDAGVVADIEFFGAALGDDVGLVSLAAEAGDFGVVPDDPGGAPYVRLFRVEGDGLIARKVEDDDMLLDEILRLAANQRGAAMAGTPTRAAGERAASFQGRREKFLATLNASLSSAGFAGRFDATTAWDLFEPLFAASFVALVDEAGEPARALVQKLGGYAAYRADPALLWAMVRQSDFAGEANPAALWEHVRPLVYRFAAACGVDGMVAPGADSQMQTRVWRLLMQPSLPHRLRVARIQIGGGSDLLRDAAAVAELLADVATVERASTYFNNRDMLDEAEALERYATARTQGEWTPLEEAVSLAALVSQATNRWKQQETETTVAVVEPRRPIEAPRPAGFFAAMRGFFRGRSPEA